ncbi:ABC transporter ATP-binding protein [Bacillus salinus]|uniref:ABC transporter ATP-binding protein n=1 Tax=Bacillus sp. HMF5848 TaxID=2495421 RepID=UPI001639CBC6|nr:ABC transporter ATP-binding protein [Bacillus sp. HMF5848]
MTKDTVLEVHNLRRSFDKKEVVRDVSFTVEKGEVFGFLGPNGAGKTTIIRMILGLIKRDSGTVTINGYSIDDQFMEAIRHVGAIVETPSFYTHLSGYANLTLIRNLHPHIAKQRIDEVLEMVHLSKVAKRKVSTYSLGMKQRLGLARALLQHPTIVFLDEPTNGLDPQGILEMREMITTLAQEQQITFIITSHILHEIEQVCDRVAILREGSIIANGFVKELLASDDEAIELRTKQLEASEKIATSMTFVKSITRSESSLVVKIEKGFSSQLNKKLVEAGIDVEYVIPQQQSLEKLFLQLTDGGQVS